MSEGTGFSTVPTQITARASEFKRFRRVFLSRGVVVFGIVIIMVFMITAIFAEFLAPYNPDTIDANQILADPSWTHILGTDTLGRDTLSRIIYGTRISLMVGVVSLAIATVIGVLIGLAAGYLGGWVQTILMRFIDALMAFPMILLALVIAALIGGGLVNVMIALGVAFMPGYARLMQGQVLSVKENDYIVASRSLGANSFRIMLRHIAPNCFPPLIVFFTMSMGMTILTEAGLSFLGIGIQPPTPAWGSMVNDGARYLETNPILSIAPGIAIMIVVFAFNMVGDGLRDALDPRLRGTF